MKPRDISVTQLWVEDLNDSLSSLESFSEEEARADESSDEEEEEVQAKRDRRQSISSRRMVLPRLNHKSNSKRQTPSASSGLRRRATFHDGCLQQQQLPAVVQTPTSKQRISTRRRRNSTFNRSTTSPPPEPSLAVSASPMRKFRMGSHISDSALSASRSCATQRRRVSQANAKWDVNNNAFQSRRSATLRGGRGSNVFQPTLVPLVSTHSNHHNNNSSNHSPSPYHGAGGDSECDCCTANSSKKGSRISHHSFAEIETDSLVSSAVGSRDTRWSTSTHTRDAASVLCRPPRRQNSGRSWQSSCGSSKCSVCSLAAEDDEDNDNNDNAKEPKEEEPQPQEQQPEQQPPQEQGPAEEAIQEEGSDDEEQEPVAAFLARQGAPRSRPQLPHRQKSFKSKTSYSMEDAIQEAIAAQTLEDFANPNDDGGSWLPSVEFPQMAIPANTSLGNSPRPDSLVSLMNPFQQKPRNRSPLQTADGNISIKSASSAESDLSRLSQLFA